MSISRKSNARATRALTVSKPVSLANKSPRRVLDNRGLNRAARVLLDTLIAQGHPWAVTPKAAAMIIRRKRYAPGTPDAQVAQTLIKAGLRPQKLGGGRTHAWLVSLPEIARWLAAGGAA